MRKQELPGLSLIVLALIVLVRKLRHRQQMRSWLLLGTLQNEEYDDPMQADLIPPPRIDLCAANAPDDRREAGSPRLRVPRRSSLDALS